MKQQAEAAAIEAERVAKEEDTRKALAEEWEQVTDAEGNQYFHHIPSGTTSWDPPECWVGRFDSNGLYVRER